MKTNWPTKKLGEVLELCDSGTWGDESPDGMPLLRSTNMQNGKLVLSDVKYINVPKEKVERYTLREGDILITKSSGSIDHIGKSLFITKEMDGKYGFSNFTQRLRVNKKQVLPKWVYLKISNPATRDFLLGASQTTTGLRNLKIPALKELEIPLPPLSEQKKIVAKLERVLAKISEAKKLRAEARENADNLLPAELHKIFEEGKKKGWKEKELGEVTKVVTGGTPKTHIAEYYGGKYLWARPGDLNEDLVVITEKKLSQSGFEDGGVRPIPTGSVMMCCIGSIGKVGIASEEMSTNQQINSFVPDTKKIDGKHLFYSLIYVREKFITGASSTTLKIINKSRCEKIKIQLPPLAEQKRIVKHLDELSQKLQKLQEYQKSTQSDLLTLEQAILQKAFL